MSQIHAIQMVSGSDVDTNMRQLEGQLRQIAQQSEPQLVVLPECFALYGCGDDAYREHAEPAGDGPLQQHLSHLARKYGIWLVAGTIPLLIPGSQQVAAACLIYDDTGTLRGRYDKIHLFDILLPDQSRAYRESSLFHPGQEPLVLETPFGRLGVGVCYDVRFPELFRAQAEALDVIALPSAFTRLTGEAHWHVLLRARAIENQCYLVAAAQEGRHEDGRQTYGHSMIVSPWGEIVAERAHGPGVISATLDNQLLQSLRSRMPVTEHRRLVCGLPAQPPVKSQENS